MDETQRQRDVWKPRLPLNGSSWPWAHRLDAGLHSDMVARGQDHVVTWWPGSWSVGSCCWNQPYWGQADTRLHQAGVLHPLTSALLQFRLLSDICISRKERQTGAGGPWLRQDVPISHAPIPFDSQAHLSPWHHIPVIRPLVDVTMLLSHHEIGLVMRNVV